MNDIDVVLLCTPTHFRPEQFKAAVEAGKHIFMENLALSILLVSVR